LRLDLEASEPFRHAVVYIPPGEKHFCVEPVSHANGQVGLASLVAGGSLAGQVVFRLSNL
jgi:aldose 1-epimerase